MNIIEDDLSGVWSAGVIQVDMHVSSHNVLLMDCAGLNGLKDFNSHMVDMIKQFKPLFIVAFYIEGAKPTSYV